MSQNNKRRKRLLPILVLFCILLLLCAAFSERLKIVRYTLETDKVTAPVRLALLTDLHSCSYGEKQTELVNAIDGEAPDFLCLAGDIFDDETPLQGAIDLLDGVADRYPCFYVTGNHEHWSDEVIVLTGLLRSYGVTVLAGDTVSFTVREQTLSISGIDDPTGFLQYGEPGDASPDTWYGQITAVQQTADPTQFTLLLAHRPEKWTEYGTDVFDLIVSGHTHGGQVRIPFLLNGLFAPNQGYFPPYAGGLYSLGKTTLIVSRGLCRNDLPRVFNRPELVIIDIVPKT